MRKKLINKRKQQYQIIVKNEKNKRKNNKSEKPKNNNKTLKVNDIKLNKFYLPKILIPKSYYACINKNRESNLDINNLHFKYIKNNLKLLNLINI